MNRLLLAGLIACLLPLLSPAQETNSSLEQLKKAYGKSRSAILKTRDLQKAEALKDYGRSLETLMSDLKKKGDLDGYLAVQAEGKRFKSEQTPPASADVSPLLAEAFDEYGKKMEAVGLADDTQTAKLLKQYSGALDDLIKKLMAQDQIEEAKIVKDERDRAALVQSDLEKQLKDRISETTPTFSGVTPVPAKPTVASAPVVWNSLGSRKEIESPKAGAAPVITGQPLFVSGKDGMAVCLRDNSSLQFDSKSLPGFDQPATYSFWFRLPEKIRDGALLSARHSFNGAGLSIWLSEQDRCLKGFVYSPNWEELVHGESLTPPLKQARWYHLALVWDFVNRIGGVDTFRVVLDGEVTYRSSAASDHMNGWRSSTYREPLTLGAVGGNGPVNQSFDGVIDEFKIMNQVVTNFNLPKTIKAAGLR